MMCERTHCRLPFDDAQELAAAQEHYIDKLATDISTMQMDFVDISTLSRAVLTTRTDEASGIPEIMGNGSVLRIHAERLQSHRRMSVSRGGSSRIHRGDGSGRHTNSRCRVKGSLWIQGGFNSNRFLWARPLRLHSASSNPGIVCFGRP